MNRFQKIVPTPPPVHGMAQDSQTGLIWSVEFSEPLKFDEIDAYIAGLNAKKHCGVDGWRRPTRAELLTLVDDTRCSPAIDTDAFPGTPSAGFWSGTTYAGDPDTYAWIVGFGYGGSLIGYRAISSCVRAVRGPARQSSASLSAEGGA